MRPRKKRKAKEGDLFAVPLLQGGLSVGLITRENRGITLGYFFDLLVYPESFNDNLDIDLKQVPVIFIGQFSSAAIEDGEWPLLNSGFKFDRNDWPIPVFKMLEPITEQYFGVVYDDSLFNNERFKIDKEAASKLFESSYKGTEALRKRVSLLISGIKN